MSFPAEGGPTDKGGRLKGLRRFGADRECLVGRGLVFANIAHR